MVIPLLNSSLSFYPDLIYGYITFCHILLVKTSHMTKSSSNRDILASSHSKGHQRDALLSNSCSREGQQVLLIKNSIYQNTTYVSHIYISPWDTFVGCSGTRCQVVEWKATVKVKESFLPFIISS